MLLSGDWCGPWSSLVGEVAVDISISMHTE